MQFLALRSFFYSLALHAVVISALIVNFDAERAPVFKPQPRENIVEAVTVDEQEVEKELQRLKEQELEKQRAMEQKLKDLEQQADAVERKRKEEEQRRQAAQQKRKEEEQRKRAAERQRKDEERRTAAERQRIEQEKLKAQAELKRIEEEKRKAQAEQARLEEEKRKAEAERKRQAEAEAKRKQLAQEQRAKDNKTLQNIVAEIYQVVTGNFNKTGLPKGLECVLSVQTIPGGEVISVTINKSSGNEVFDRRAVTAVDKASPLPLPADAVVFERLGLRKFNFKFAPRD